jgi:hypothetical protein
MRVKQKKQYAYIDGIHWLKHVNHLHTYTSTGCRQHEMVLVFCEANVSLYGQCNGDAGNDISLAVHMQGHTSRGIWSNPPRA